MQYFQNVLSLTVTGTSLFDAFDLIGFDDALVTAADAPVKCVAQNPCTEIGQQIAGLAIGTARVKAVGVIAAGNDIVSAVGGASAAGVDPSNVFARALTSAADGEFVTILMR